MKTATIETAKGAITLELFETDAPKTVQNFETLAKKGFYDGLRFHRVVPNFVIQGGCPNSRDANDPRAGQGGPGYTIPCETKGNRQRHVKGALSMAHRGPDTGGSQFFITLRETPHLDGVHTVFGKVVSGQDVVERVAQGDVIRKVTVAETPAKA
jgi:peptidyl-prolyl cis-trans isomerase B (cyclophilin B)